MQTPLQAAREGQGGRRFGVAIAFVLLLILLSLALSIVLKPRGHDMPAELSQAQTSAQRLCRWGESAGEPGARRPDGGVRRERRHRHARHARRPGRSAPSSAGPARDRAAWAARSSPCTPSPSCSRTRARSSRRSRSRASSGCGPASSSNLEALDAAGAALRWARHLFPPRTPEPAGWAVLVDLLDCLDAAIAALRGASSRARASRCSRPSGYALELEQCASAAAPCPEGRPRASIRRAGASCAARAGARERALAGRPRGGAGARSRRRRPT